MSHDMPTGRRIYEGKAKVLFEGPDGGTLVQYFKDDTTAFNAEKHEIMVGKGILNLRISEFIFAELEKIGVPTHFIETINPRQQLIRAAEIIPLEVVMRNVAAGSLVKRLGLTEGDALPRVGRRGTLHRRAPAPIAVSFCRDAFGVGATAVRVELVVQAPVAAVFSAVSDVDERLQWDSILEGARLHTALDGRNSLIHLQVSAVHP